MVKRYVDNRIYFIQSRYNLAGFGLPVLIFGIGGLRIYIVNMKFGIQKVGVKRAESWSSKVSINLLAVLLWRRFIVYTVRSTYSLSRGWPCHTVGDRTVATSPGDPCDRLFSVNTFWPAGLVWPIQKNHKYYTIYLFIK